MFASVIKSPAVAAEVSRTCKVEASPARYVAAPDIKGSRAGRAAVTEGCIADRAAAAGECVAGKAAGTGECSADRAAGTGGCIKDRDRAAGTGECVAGKAAATGECVAGRAAATGECSAGGAEAVEGFCRMSTATMGESRDGSTEHKPTEAPSGTQSSSTASETRASGAVTFLQAVKMQ